MWHIVEIYGAKIEEAFLNEKIIRASDLYAVLQSSRFVDFHVRSCKNINIGQLRPLSFCAKRSNINGDPTARLRSRYEKSRYRSRFNWPTIARRSGQSKNEEGPRFN